MCQITKWKSRANWKEYWTGPNEGLIISAELQRKKCVDKTSEQRPPGRRGLHQKWEARNGNVCGGVARQTNQGEIKEKNSSNSFLCSVEIRPRLFKFLPPKIIIYNRYPRHYNLSDTLRGGK
jgi:hypothetical protein